MTQDRAGWTELRKLVELLENGELDEPRKARLEELVINDRDARQFFVESMFLSGQLRWEHDSELTRRCEPAVFQAATIFQAAPTAKMTCHPVEPRRSPVLGFLSTVNRRTWSTAGKLTASLAAIGIVAAVVLFSMRRGEHEPASAAHEASGPVARLDSADCRWVDSSASLSAGSPLFAGEKLELASGLVNIVFQSGARVTLIGPAIFEIESDNSGFLTIGQLNARADTPTSHGFTIRSRTSSITDLGTEFNIQASDDGHSKVSVASGAVEVQAGKNQSKYRLREGQSIEVEPGSPSVIARIEPGEDSSVFKFPTIEPPSSTDYADASLGHAKISVVEGHLAPDSGPVELLLDGKGQTVADAPTQSVFFANGTTGKVLLDLGKAIAVQKINTYSWHQKYYDAKNRGRAPQKYYLYGASSAQPPSVQGNLAANGWKLIARVNTDEFFAAPDTVQRPPQQAVSVRGVNGTVGSFRYLLWDVRASHPETQPANMLQGTFFGEFDVYEK